ncbi:xylulokinase [Enterococcus massiliensis]|uniref:xylulokinase n=1 Tax=Enterococcus massiliensis TaxID=1640685 RepID=UPI00065E48F3
MKEMNRENTVLKKTALGIELGSTRIKAVLIDETFQPIASGSFEWENQLENGIWTYSTENIWKGLQVAYARLKAEVEKKYNTPLTTIGAIGFSAMMHGYLAFDAQDQLLIPFRTWRNAITAEAEEKLTEVFHYNIPQRWSIAHLYQAILNKEEHVKDVSFLTTLAGYVHWQLTGEKVLGIGDASGMFPIDIHEKNYDQKKIDQFHALIPASLELNLSKVLPKVLLAGESAGTLTQAGALLLDPTGTLQPGIPLCPPEGDAGTGMVATNSVAPRSGNVSAGTSAFAMIVLEQDLVNVYPEIDLVTTPSGDLVAMVHTNNCSSDLNAWASLFKEFGDLVGVELSSDKLYQLLFEKALQADLDSGKLLSFGYYSGENITKMTEGRPLFVRLPTSEFTLANFMYTHLASAFGAMRIGMDILKKEKIHLDKLVGHGGIFKTPEVGQRILASAMEAPVTVMDTAGEGGAWGIALLAAFVKQSASKTLAEFLEETVFAQSNESTIAPTKEDLQRYEIFIDRYKNGLPIEQSALEALAMKEE